MPRAHGLRLQMSVTSSSMLSDLPASGASSHGCWIIPDILPSNRSWSSLVINMLLVPLTPILFILSLVVTFSFFLRVILAYIERKESLSMCIYMCMYIHQLLICMYRYRSI